MTQQIISVMIETGHDPGSMAPNTNLIYLEFQKFDGVNWNGEYGESPFDW
jgi:hypothetical protein